MTLPVAVLGASGRMGRILLSLIESADDLRFVGGVHRHSDAASQGQERPMLVGPEMADSILRESRVIVDFSAPQLLGMLLDRYPESFEARALVVGTTGLDEMTQGRLDALAKRAAVLVSANFSIGVNLLLRLAEVAARALPAAEFDVEIVEVHHRHKGDAPSGTALALGRAVASGRETGLEECRRDGRSGRTGERPVGEIGFHAVRGGEVPGEHRVLFLGVGENLEFAHTAVDRRVFAEGALVAARWLAGRPPGRYTMAQVLGLEAGDGGDGAAAEEARGLPGEERG